MGSADFFITLKFNEGKRDFFIEKLERSDFLPFSYLVKNDSVSIEGYFDMFLITVQMIYDFLGTAECDMSDVIISTDEKNPSLFLKM